MEPAEVVHPVTQVGALCCRAFWNALFSHAVLFFFFQVPLAELRARVQDKLAADEARVRRLGKPVLCSAIHSEFLLGRVSGFDAVGCDEDFGSNGGFVLVQS